MDDITRAKILSAAEKLFDRDALYKLASSVSETQKRKSLRFWQDEMLSELSKRVGVDITSKPHFIAVFKGTAEKYYTPLSPDEQAELDEAKQQLRDQVNKIGKKVRKITRGGQETIPPGVPQEPLNDVTREIGFHVTFSLQELVESLLRHAEEDGRSKRNLHICCELIRARHLGANVPVPTLIELANDSVDAAIDDFDAGRTSLEGWYRPLSEGMFACAFLGMNRKMARLCQWATPRKKPGYEGPLDNEIQELTLVTAGLFQGSLKPGFVRKLSRCSESRKARIRLLANMVQAIYDCDQDAFQISTQKAVQNYRKRKTPDPNLAILSKYLPVHINTAYYAGLCHGMTRCCFPDSVAAYLCDIFDDSKLYN
ncbi:hypothetical protein [Rhodopirellula baltica]|uniref:Uncharacterized protein n=1 Tax=Rhodopirellula baltica SWK14 TaxID=993516 RepID=L7CHG8_RHOBT|nr:hypothetical protein [Rhodopirellula baltica]ELP33057.1 hypothetical protein RBSWK_02903 [Rhodopirellula baltica SWK14]